MPKMKDRIYYFIYVFLIFLSVVAINVYFIFTFSGLVDALCPHAIAYILVQHERNMSESYITSISYPNPPNVTN